jgi:uncharacterized protein
LSQAALINCWFSSACSFAPGFRAVAVLAGRGLGRVVEAADELVTAVGEIACADGLDLAAPSLPHAAVAKATAVRTAREQADLIGRAYERGVVTYRWLALRQVAEGTLAAMTASLGDDGSVFLVSANDPRAVAATEAIQAGDLPALERMLAADPWLAAARIGDWDCYRTLLHAATDWPGHFPNGPAVVERLVAAGADVNAHSQFSSHTETPLHWAASSDDVDVLDALLDAGADIEAPGAVLGGGGALADACGFGNWAAARRLVERGARTRLSDAAALGLLDRVKAIFADEPSPDRDVITMAFWNACHGGQRATAEYLLDRGAEINWIGWDDKTPLDLVDEASQPELATWLRARGGKHVAELRE